MSTEDTIQRIEGNDVSTSRCYLLIILKMMVSFIFDNSQYIAGEEKDKNRTLENTIATLMYLVQSSVKSIL